MTEHVHWRRSEWCNILFSSESHFYLPPDNRRIFIWRECITQNNPAFVHKSVRFNGGRVMIYSGISINGCTDLHIIRNGVLTDRQYRDEVLRPIAVPYATTIKDDFRLMSDSCRPQCAHLVNDFL